MYLIRNEKRQPVEVVDDLYFYKIHNSWRCLVCKQMGRANFTHMTFKDDKIYFWLNCVSCGEDSFYYITEKKLNKLMMEWFFNPKIDPESFEMSIWRMIQLARHYETCLKSRGDQMRFRELWHDLNRYLSRWGWWYRFKYRG
jgi:hypothetical protein